MRTNFIPHDQSILKESTPSLPAEATAPPSIPFRGLEQPNPLTRGQKEYISKRINEFRKQNPRLQTAIPIPLIWAGMNAALGRAREQSETFMSPCAWVQGFHVAVEDWLAGAAVVEEVIMGAKCPNDVRALEALAMQLWEQSLLQLEQASLSSTSAQECGECFHSNRAFWDGFAKILQGRANEPGVRPLLTGTGLIPYVMELAATGFGSTEAVNVLIEGRQYLRLNDLLVLFYEGGTRETEDIRTAARHAREFLERHKLLGNGTLEVIAKKEKRIAKD